MGSVLGASIYGHTVSSTQNPNLSSGSLQVRLKVCVYIYITKSPIWDDACLHDLYVFKIQGSQYRPQNAHSPHCGDQ